MEKRFYYIDNRTLVTKKGSYKQILVYDNESFATVGIFVNDETFDYFKEIDTLTDISYLLRFSYDNKSGLYRLTIKRKE